MFFVKFDNAIAVLSSDPVSASTFPVPFFFPPLLARLIASFDF